MLEAIHKESKKKITAFEIINSLEWHGKERDTFIAPYHEVDNWEEQSLKGINECEVTFVKRHKRYEGTDKEETVSEHFRILTDGFIENINNESEQHKLAKKYIYDNYENIIIQNFNKKLIEIANIKNIRIEKGVGEKRADVLIDFEKDHEILGRGIAFEIQISPQSEYETVERSFDRAAYGYSVCWIWSKDLRQFNNRVKVIPFNEALKEYNEQAIKEGNERISLIAEKAKIFNRELEEEINNKVKENEKILQNISLLKNNDLNEYKKIWNGLLEKQKEEINNKSQQLKDEFRLKLSEIKEEYVSNLRQNVSDILKELDVKSIIESMIDNNIKNIVNKDNPICYYCQSNDTHEYNDCYFCFNCKRRSYKK